MAKVAANGGSDPIEDATATETELRVDVASQPGDKTASTCDIEALLEKVARALGKKRMLANAQELAFNLAREGVETYGDLRNVNRDVLREAGFNTFEVLAMLRIFTPLEGVHVRSTAPKSPGVVPAPDDATSGSTNRTTLSDAHTISEAVSSSMATAMSEAMDRQREQDMWQKLEATTLHRFEADKLQPRSLARAKKWLQGLQTSLNIVPGFFEVVKLMLGDPDTAVSELLQVPGYTMHADTRLFAPIKNSLDDEDFEELGGGEAMSAAGLLSNVWKA